MRVAARRVAGVVGLEEPGEIQNSTFKEANIGKVAGRSSLGVDLVNATSRVPAGTFRA
jgi:hypothetical protein